MKKFLLVFVALFCTVLLVGCGTEYRKKMAGTYVISSMKSDSETVTAEQMKKLGIKYELVVKDDGTALLNMGDDKTKLEYDEKYFNEKGDSKSKIKYSIKGKTLTLSDDDMSMEFKKK